MAALVVAAVADVTQHPPQAPLDVGIDDDLGTAANPLSDDEVSELRDRSDPQRLRCVPSGCERWRYERGDAPMASGAVTMADGAVLVLLGQPRGSRTPPAPGTDDREDLGDHDGGPPGAGTDAAGTDAEGADEEAEEALGHQLVAIDAATGQARWTRPVRDLPGVSGAYRWVRLLPGVDGGALVVSGTTVTAVDADGHQRWSAPADRHGAPRDIWQAVATDGAVVLATQPLDRSSPTHHLAALDPTTGGELWNAEVAQLVDVDGDRVVVIDRDGTLRARHATTGQTTWSRPGTVSEASAEGQWLAVQDGATLHLVDPGSGTDVATTEGWLTSPLVMADELWVGTIRGAGGGADVSLWGNEAATMRLAAFDRSGAEVWTASLGSIRPWWNCCPILTDRDAGIVTALGPRRDLHHDLETGRLVDVDVVAEPRKHGVEPRGLTDGTVRYAAPDIEVVVAEGGKRIDVHRQDGWTTVRSGRSLTLESLDPLVITDGRELLGVAIVDDRTR